MRHIIQRLAALLLLALLCGRPLMAADLDLNALDYLDTQVFRIATGASAPTRNRWPMATTAPTTLSSPVA